MAAAAPSGPSPAIPSPAIPPSSPSVSPPPTTSSPPTSQPNANADPPTSSNPPPPVPGPPPTASSPPPIPDSPLPISPPVASPPPPISPSPPPPKASPPPPSASPPTPPVSSPPPAAPPPSSSSPSPPVPSLPPPVRIPTPPPDGSPPPPITAPPPAPSKPSPPTPAKASPPPPSTKPPKNSSPPVNSPPPPHSPPPILPPMPAKPSSAPPPSTKSPKNSSPPVNSPPPLHSPPPILPPMPAKPSAPPPSTKPPPNSSPPVNSPPPPDSQPSNPLPLPPPPPRNRTQPVPSAPPPRNSSPPTPVPPGSSPSNPTPSDPPSVPPKLPQKPSPPVPFDKPVPPASPTPSKSSNSTPGASLPGDINFKGGGGIKTGTAVGIAVVVILVVLGLVGIVLWFVTKRKKHSGGFGGGYVMPSPFQSSQMSESSYPRSPTPLVKNSSGSHGYSPSDLGLGHSRSWFTYEELSEATNGFSTQNLLGEGGFGCVYKGSLPDGREVAVKHLKVGGGQGEREFQAEVEIISRVHHRHLVSLVGYCISEHQRLLVYDYVPNDTLYYHLHGQGRPVMDWATRVKVASGAARGIAYLHEDCHPRIIHRDIKSSNILLDNNFEAQVSDFGLAKLAMDANTHVTTRVMGTFGYLAPEYASSGKLTDRSDVFSFGVVLLELVTGRKPVDGSQPLGDESLVEWARPLMARALDNNGDFEDLPDLRLENKYNESEMFRMIEVAAACVRHSAAMRPRMGQVVRALDGLGESLDLHNGVKPGQSELFNSAQQSAEIRLFQRMAFGNQDYSSDFSQTSWKRDL